jgi:3-hydroxyisobutyrate dehydrogenase
MPDAARHALPTIGFFGVGAMGFPMARRLVAAGYAVAIADPAPAFRARWEAAYGPGAHAAAAADVLVSCVTNEVALEGLLFGAGGLLANAREGALYIDHTTASPRVARRAAEVAIQHGALFVDAPISGGEAAAGAGTLSVFAGGAVDAVQRAQPVLACYAGRVTHLGGPGCGQVGKLANQIAIAGNVRGLAEAVALARVAGLDVTKLVDALGAGSARSNQLEQHGAKLSAPEFAFDEAFAWLAQDLVLALAEARLYGADLPQTQLVKRMLER